jgi:hypothetical protein
MKHREHFGRVMAMGGPTMRSQKTAYIGCGMVERDCSWYLVLAIALFVVHLVVGVRIPWIKDRDEEITYDPDWDEDIAKLTKEE